MLLPQEDGVIDSDKSIKSRIPPAFNAKEKKYQDFEVQDHIKKCCKMLSPCE